jgi:hypothetical protein
MFWKSRICIRRGFVRANYLLILTNSAGKATE